MKQKFKLLSFTFRIVVLDFLGLVNRMSKIRRNARRLRGLTVS